jgi:tRNA threonylcarbamoyladenosine biosynthesis protein TsaB
MLLLVVDTSGKNGSVALARGGDAPDPGKLEVIQEVPLAGGMFSAQLVPQIATLLADHGFRKTQIDVFVAVSGPGSFTGLRVGLAAIKALAEVLRKPIVPVSLLEVVAVGAKTEGRVLAALDAGRGEVYVGEYEISSRSAQPHKEQVVSEELVSRDEFLSSAKGSLVSTSDAALAQMMSDAGLSVFTLEKVTAAMIARVGWAKLQAGATVTPEQLEANYIRRTDAEIFSKPISKSK